MRAELEVHPGTVCRISGTQHLVRAEVTRMERRGEIMALREQASLSRGGVLTVPYIRLKSVEQVRRSRRLRRVLGAMLLLAVLAGAGWLVWQARYAIALLTALALGGVVVFWLSLHWRHGCSGIHCAGCRG